MGGKGSPPMAKDNDAAGTAAPATEPGGTVRRRLGEAAGSLGRPLRELEGLDVVVTALAFEGGRKIKALADNQETGVKRGELVEATAGIVTVESSDQGGTRYFTFSPSLIDKLRAVDAAELPMDARFIKRELEGGQSVWDVE